MLISNSAASHMRLQELEPDEEDFALPAGAKGPGASGTAAPAADTAAPEPQAWQPPVSSSALSQLPPTPMQVQERQRLVVERQAEQQERAQLPERGAGSNGRGPGADAGSGSPAAPPPAVPATTAVPAATARTAAPVAPPAAPAASAPAAPQFALATASNRATGPRMRSFIDDPDEPGLRRDPPTRPGLGQPPAASPPSAPIEPPQPSPPYAGERSADPEWLAERETALKAVRADYEAQGATARANGSGAGWIEVETVGESTTTCSLEFSEETFAAHYRAQAGAPLQTLARSYATDAATLLEREPGIWALCTQDHALNAGPAQAGRAMGDPGQLATLDLYMADPQVAELIDRFGGNVAAPSGPVALEQVRVHGAARYAQLTRLDHAMQAVRADYSHAMQQAQQQGGPGWLETPLTWTATDEAGTISSGTLLKRDDDGNVVRGPDGAPVAQTRRDFDPDAFTAWYVQQDGVANKAFAAFYGRSHTTWGESVINEGGATTKSAEISFDNPSWHISGIGAPMVHRALATIDPNRPPRLNDPTAVGFDLEAGWATSAGNIHQSRDWFETVVQVGLVAFTGYVGALVIGPAAAGGLGFATGSVGAAVVSGAVAGAASSLASGVINGDVSLKGVLQGALSGGLTAGLMGSLGNTVTTAAGPVGTIALRATVQGGINALLGGKFETGAIAGLASGLAAQLGADMSKGIDKALAEGTMDAGQAIAARSMARIVTSAVRVLGNPGDAQYAFASDLLGGLVTDGLDAADRARLPATPSDGEPSFIGAAFDDEGNLMPGIVDLSATPVQQQAQLLAHLQAQGMSEEDAASLTYETLVQDAPQTLQPPSAESSTWTPQEL